MTNLETRATQLRPHLILEELIARHGIWHVLRATLRAHKQLRLQKRPQIGMLNDHLRRDLGLAPQDAPPRWLP